MPRILGISCSPIKGGNTEVFLKEALTACEAHNDVTTKLLSLANLKIGDCKQCGWCLSKQEEGKFCAQKDDMAGIYPELLEIDGLFIATPVYLGRLSGYAACFMDRLRPFAEGNLYRRRLRNKVAGALAVGWRRHSGLEMALVSVVSGILALEMLPVNARARGSHFGAIGLSSEGGTGKFDPEDKLAVLKDEYGLKSVRAVAERMVELTQLLAKAG